MRVLLAGATGAVGRRLIPLLIERGHEVTTMTRRPENVDALRAAGTAPVLADALDRTRVLEVVASARPDVVVHHLTGLAGSLDFRHFEQTFTATNALRTRGTDHLLEAARASGARRFVAQSFAGWPYARTGGPVKVETDPLDPDPPKQLRRTLEAIRHLEAAVTGADGLDGLVLRCGAFYGPGTSLGPEGGEQIELIRKRRWPVVGGGTGVWSLIHVDDVATATVAAVEGGPAGVYNIVDDEPAPVHLWLPYLAAMISAKPPRHVPAWVGRLAAGEHGLAMMTTVRGASNAKARRDLAWTPGHPTWREGFQTLQTG